MTRRKFIICLAVFSAAAWLLYALLGGPLARALEARFGGKVHQMAGGKPIDARMFIQRRLRESALLVSAVALIAAAHVLALAGIEQRISPRLGWVFGALSGFVCLNVLALVAAHTLLFWALLNIGSGSNDHFTQYQIKRGYLREMQASRQAVLLGSSQTSAEIDKNLLNDRLGKQLWTTDLHFPGDKAYDLVLSMEDLPPVQVNYVVCYLSESYFCGHSESERMKYFMGFRDLPQFYDMGGGSTHPDSHFAYGLLGHALPLFRLRDPLLGRILGSRVMDLGQEKWDSSLDLDLARRARSVAPGFLVGPATLFQEKAFGVFAAQCRQRRAVLIVCCGQMNPILGRIIDPALRAEMLSFLRNQAAQDTNIVLLDETRMPPQTELDYDDLNHVNRAAQMRFSEFIAGVLDHLMSAR